jgi:hypothetical protein
MTATRERAINLRDWEVRANQDGRLKMLVRPVKPQPNNPEVFGVSPIWGSCVPTEDTPGVRSGSIPAECIGRYSIHAATNENGRRVDRWIACPYGQPGDRLRGREAAAINDTGRPAARYHFNAHVKYKADGLNLNFDVDLKHWRTAFENNALRYQSSIHMPRWAVRNWLEITEVRCGRVREMSEQDGWDCGIQVMEQSAGQSVYRWYGIDRPLAANVLSAVATLYETDHGEGSWERDWVWMIGVKRIEGGV